jgi:hypothetical protein
VNDLTKKETLPKKKENREGLAGSSFYGLFGDCPRKWAIKYILGFKELKTARPLIYGSAIHEGMEVFYETNSKDKMIETVLNYLDLHSSNYINPNDCTKDKTKATDSLEYWYDTYGQYDLEKFDILGNELAFTYRLENGLDYILRPDRLIKEKSTGHIYVLDTKTTGVSVTYTVRRIAKSDQPVGYLAGIKPIYGNAFRGWISDIIVATGRKVDAFRPEPLEYDPYVFKLWEYSLMSLIEDLTGRYKMLNDGGSLEFLFPYRKSACSVYSCPYQEICTKHLTLDSNPEDYGFILDPWIKESKVKDLMESNFKKLSTNI